MSYRVRHLTPAECVAVAGWKYGGDYACYDPDDAISPEDGYWAVEDADGSFVGYCCFGAEARVPGLGAEPGVIDVGVGMAPDLTGEGRSRGFVEAVLDFGIDAFEPERFRALVLDWNERSLAACRAAGFTQVGEHVHDDRRFVIVERPA